VLAEEGSEGERGQTERWGKALNIKGGVERVSAGSFKEGLFAFYNNFNDSSKGREAKRNTIEGSESKRSEN